MNAKKTLSRLLKIFFIGGLPAILLFGVIIIALVPVIWVGNLLTGRTEAQVHEPTLDELTTQWQVEHRVSFNQSELITCTMVGENELNIQGCLDLISEDGTYGEDDLDWEYVQTYEYYKQGIVEWQGKAPDNAFDYIWLPTLYVVDHYKEVQTPILDVPVTDPNYGMMETTWEYDYTSDTIYRDSCSDNAPYTQCRVIREGYDVYPYRKPSNVGQATYPYGFSIYDPNTGSMQFSPSLQYSNTFAVSISTGKVESINGSTVILVYHNGDFTFYAEYSDLMTINVEVDQEIEIGSTVGSSELFSVSTYILNDSGQRLYFNPYMLLNQNQISYGSYNEVYDGEIVGIDGFEWQMPFSAYSVTQEFGGMNINGATHNGIDLVPADGQVAEGHPIFCGVEGVVVSNEYNSTSGNLIAIKDNKTGIIIRYCHMIEPSLLSYGTPVSRGQVIGYVGMTGVATGYHVHISFVVNGQWVNPRQFVDF